MLMQLQRLITQGYTMIQLRAKSLTDEQFKGLAATSLALCEEKLIVLFLNTRLELAIELNAHAVHLSVAELSSHSVIPKGMLLAASCHNADELNTAQSLCALFAVLSPVCMTKTHPETPPLGWAYFANCSRQLNLPVYALGGLGPNDLPRALQHGAQGVSGIRGFVA